MKAILSKNRVKRVVLAAAMAAAVVFPVSAPAAGSATVSIQADQPGTVISSNLFGIFFEEINFGGDGGIYAEMVRNRSFQQSSSPDEWTLARDGSANGSITVDVAEPLNTNVVSSLRLTRTGGTGNVGAANGGYWGMSVEAGAAYNLSFYAKDNGSFSGSINARLENADGSTAYTPLTTVASPSSNWQKYTVTLTSTGTDHNARLVVSINQAGSVWLSMVSLFPENTYMGRENGLRPDLANKLAALEPSFLRFPGGNFVESWHVDTAVRWKKGIGDLAQRPGHDNNSWGYWSSDGLGAHEFFQWCEDMGMEPLYDINAGLMLGYNGSPDNTVPLEEMGPWVQDALDLIEYANGDTNTTWGAVRAANGHPAPFNMKYLEIGNENGGSYLDERYTLFYDAIKAEYPDIHLIAPGNWSGGRPTSRPVEIMDEHYYSNPSTFISYANKYDNYDRNGPKVFVGEYAVTSGAGTYGNLAAALGEAVFMTGMERNSDLVVLAAYAPLFANVNGIQWHPDLIYYDNYRCFGTPAYYVQQMFSRNRGHYTLPTTINVSSTATNPAPHGAIGLGSWNTAVEYDDILVTSNGVTLYQTDFSSGTGEWNVYKGSWGVSGGAYQQTDIATDCRSTTGDTDWADYTISLRARKLSGSEGFLIMVNWQDDNNWTWLNLGGWNNSQHAVEYAVNGGKTILGAAVPGSIDTQWHDIDIVIDGYNVKCYLDGGLVLDVDYPIAASSGLYASTSFNEDDSQVIVKAVNPYDTAVDTTFELSGIGSVASNGTVIQLTSGSAADENSLASPTFVSPVTNLISNAGTNFTITLPANSLSVLRLNAGGINSYTNLLLEVPTPIGSGGQQVASMVWGELSGVWSNLTANANHALVWSSSDPSVAGVDAYGHVTGLQAGETTITATYGALALSASQLVQVTNSSATVALAHRYSFSEISGTDVADSIAGPVWDGWLPEGGMFNGSGQLDLAAAQQQYVELPAGILSNYTAVTIDVWASFGALPTACFLYGFGDISGSTGYDYIFCQPRNGRIAITDDNYASEQNAYGNFDCSGRTDLHLTAVFNPPIGAIALYTNGVLAGLNSTVTIPLSSVNNAFSYIGRSLYSGDSYFDFTLDELRIYDGALTEADIAATDALGPDQVLNSAPPALQLSLVGGPTLSWPLTASGWTLFTTTNLALGNWMMVSEPPQIVGSEWQVDVPATNNQQFYRLQK